MKLSLGFGRTRNSVVRCSERTKDVKIALKNREHIDTEQCMYTLPKMW
jgi:hypothetical protein